MAYPFGHIHNTRPPPWGTGPRSGTARGNAFGFPSALRNTKGFPHMRTSVTTPSLAFFPEQFVSMAQMVRRRSSPFHIHESIR